jgi:hypothetical protein
MKGNMKRGAKSLRIERDRERRKKGERRKMEEPFYFLGVS